MKILEKIKGQGYLLFDGAMGTYMTTKYDAGIRQCELENIFHPQHVQTIHQEYIEAGAQAIKTNTFCANTDQNISIEKVEQIIRSGCKIAKDAVGDRDIEIFADMGPMQRTHGVIQEYEKMIDWFYDCGLRNFLFETFSDPDIPIQMSRYIKEKDPNTFVLTQYSITPDGYTVTGITGSSIIKKIQQEKRIDAYGFNCMSGPKHLLEYIQKTDVGEGLISIMPNAGYPTIVNNRTVFSTDPVYFGQKLVEIRDYGAVILGGCCGTTPEHIYQAAKLLRSQPKQVVVRERKERKKVLPKERETLHERKLIAVEIDPPADAELTEFMGWAQTLKECGADIITIADCPIARARMDSSMLAAKLHRELGVCAMPHMTCRDRNLNATKALLLGLYVEGIRRALFVTGDPIADQDRGTVKGVFNFNSIQLASYVRSLNETVFCEEPIKIAGALNINAANYAAELERAKRKQEAGMDMFLTQPVYSEEGKRNIRLAKEKLGAPILAGIFPIVSYRNACFMNNEVSGITIPKKLMEQYKDKSKEECAQISIAFSLELMQELEEDTAGFYIMTPLKRIDIVKGLIQERRKGK